MTAQLEHTNVTVADPDKTAAWMCDLFGWHIRWAGDAKNGGRSVHVGSDASYLALYKSPVTPAAPKEDNYETIGGLNHIAMTVDDIDAAETAVEKLGFTPMNHGDYEPGRRFYFYDDNDIEFELVSYA